MEQSYVDATYLLEKYIQMEVNQNYLKTQLMNRQPKKSAINYLFSRSLEQFSYS